VDRAPFSQLPYAEVPESPRIPHRYFETDERSVTFDSRPFGRVRVHVRVFGSGPPLLLLHGLMTTSYSWRYVLEPLGARHTLYMPDLVGAGRSDKPDRSYHPDALADSIGETMTALGIYGAPIIGNSLGGYLAMRLSLRDPAAMSRLVNLHSPGLPTARMYALAGALALLPEPGFLALLRFMVLRDPLRWVHKNVHYFDETLKSRQEHEQYAAPISCHAGIRAFGRMLSQTLHVGAMREFARTLKRLSRFPVPLCLIYAERDPMVPPIVGDRLRALLPQAQFVKLKDASHFAHVDAPQAFVKAVLPFLEEKN
jgi:pimeloyl-ACP methyl ester carboxylesterase